MNISLNGDQIPIDCLFVFFLCVCDRFWVLRVGFFRSRFATNSPFRLFLSIGLILCIPVDFLLFVIWCFLLL